MLPSTPATPTSPAAASTVQDRAVRVLAGSQVLAGVGVASGAAVGGLLAEELSGSTSLSGLAQTASVLGAAVAALPMARVMAAHGRRPGLVLGYGLGALGAVVVLVAALVGSFPLQVLGSALFGAATAAGLQARYAATDLAPAARRGRALAVVVWATTVGAVVGPALSAPGAALARALGVPELAGPYLFSLLSFLLGGGLVATLLRPDPLLEARRHAAADAYPGLDGAADGVAAAGAGGGVAGGARSTVRGALHVIRRSPAAVVGLAAVVSAHAVMVAVMIMTPVHLHHGGASLHVIGLVISVHVAGMYALSPVVGWLADRLGRAQVVVLGQGILLAAVALAGALPAASTVGVGLFLLGLGWSCALVAGSTLLSESVPLADRPAVQGAADFVMGVVAAAAGALAGVALGRLGYGGLNLVAALLVVPVLVLALPLARRGSAHSE